MAVVAEESKRMARSPHLQLGSNVRLMAIFIEIWADHNWDRWETALIGESDHSVGWNETQTKRTFREWGVVDRQGVYGLAGLTKRQSEVAELHFEGQKEPREIAGVLGCEPATVHVHLHSIRERLRRLAA